MNKNNYKNAIDKIHAKDELKEKTFEKIKAKNNKKILYIKYIASCAMIVIVFSMSIMYFNNNKQNFNLNNIENEKVADVQNDLPRFQNMEELKEVLQKNRSRNSYIKGTYSIDSIESQAMNSDSASESADYSSTNVQVENVDEADIVKTDGNYIYYVANNKVYIVEAKELKVMSEVEINYEDEKVLPTNIYVYENKLVLLGNSYEKQNVTKRNVLQDVISETSNVQTKNMAEAIVYDITNKENPKQTRKVAIDGNYIESRMIEDNLYFISRKSIYYYSDVEDDALLPEVKDTAIPQESKLIQCTDIVYFKESKSYSYMTVAGFNINDNKEVNTETFFGASSDIYASENNLYITQNVYNEGFIYKTNKNIIYKFKLEGAKIKLQTKGEVKGNINNQFSMDEYEGNLRVATTSSSNGSTSNQLYILDENLNQIGKIENFAKDEKIYSVRFIGKTGYIVTFKQIDPLFVIDLSDPTNPEVKGELKIPGYSSYLHPYDEKHIIGIGYNTKSNGYGGITNANMKMSMFDVSDLSNPKEMFSINIGDRYAYSEITSNHKALFYNKNKNLIGFPVTYREYNYYDDRNAFTIFKIDLEKGFEKYGEISQKINYETNIDRAIYIGDVLYTLSDYKIISYDLINMNKIKEVQLESQYKSSTIIE